MKLSLPFYLLLVLFSCSTPPAGKSPETRKTLKEFEWFIAKWEGDFHDMEVHEYWRKESDTLFSGDGYVLSDKDTVFHEQTQLVIKDNAIHYVAHVPQNPVPVWFRLTRHDDSCVVFENPKHDFPKIITYLLIRPDSLVAVITGEEDGKARKEEFHFKKKH